MRISGKIPHIDFFASLRDDSDLNTIRDLFE